MIYKLAARITNNTKRVIMIALILLIPAILGMIFTPVNYDILSYLPDELDSVKGINILDKDFNEASMGIIILDDVTWAESKTIEESISEVEGVKTVLWIGAVADYPIPTSMLPESMTSMLYSADKDSTLMMVQFSTPGSSSATLKAIGEIQDILPASCLMSGTAAMTYEISDMMLKEVPIYAAIAVGLALIALGLTMESFMLPVVMLMALGMSIVYNMGTNFIFGQVSFITQAIAAILQLGVTMDYSIFLMDRYVEEKPRYRSREAAMTKAIVETFASLAGSSMTTVFGFLALCFMSFTLGLDMGLVMAKGVVMGIITVVTILPAMLLVFERSIEKTRHRSLIPPFGGLNKVTIKLRKVIAIIFILLLIPAWYGQNNVEKYYNMVDAMPDRMESIAAMDVLKEDFNMASMNMVLIDSDMADTKKIALADELAQVDGISSVISLTPVMGTSFSVDILPDSIRTMLSTAGKELIILNSVYPAATDECNAQLDTLHSIIKSYDSNAYITGEAPMYKDLVTVTDKDFIITNIISIVAIFIVIAFIFKSFSLPLILVLSIELAIWINIAISYMTGEEICFITPTVISCVQLGATVDYAILLTTRFREEIQKGKDKKDAMKAAADSAHRSIFQSSLVFFAATIGVSLVCDVDIVSSMCTMLSRGAIISAVVIIVFLTPILVVCEGFINKTTYKWREPKQATEFTAPMLENLEREIEKSDRKKRKAEKAQAAAVARVAKTTTEFAPRNLNVAAPQESIRAITTDTLPAAAMTDTDRFKPFSSEDKETLQPFNQATLMSATMRHSTETRSVARVAKVQNTRSEPVPETGYQDAIKDFAKKYMTDINDESDNGDET